MKGKTREGGEDCGGVTMWISEGRRLEEEVEHTLDMNNPNAPPNAKPIPPAMMDLTRHDSMPDCTWDNVQYLARTIKGREVPHHLDIFLLLFTHTTCTRLGRHPGKAHLVVLSMNRRG